MAEIRFAFGKNWQQYVQHALTEERISQARNAFHALCENIDMQGRAFLDIGFGQGLALFFAQEMRAEVLGIDRDKDAVKALTRTAMLFASQPLPHVQIASILDNDFIKTQLQNRQFDIVHSWGTLHHTGNMTQALDNAARLVKKEGYLIISIYNQHWSSPLWRCIKWVYNISPFLVQKALIRGLYPIIYAAKFFVTGKNPKLKTRGMDFFYDVVDWVGGYPYEYASISRIKELVCSKNFVCVRVIPTQVPTGCNQFVFQKQYEENSL